MKTEINYLIIVLFLFLFWSNSFSQNTFRCIVKDSVNNEPLIGATVKLENTKTGSITNNKGEAELKNFPDGEHKVIISYLGYRTKEYKLSTKSADTNAVEILLAPEHLNLEEIEVVSSRTNSRIEDLPIKVEVLGKDDVEEETMILPSNITGFLGDLSVITIQRTNSVNGNDVVRMQGLDSRFTQILRDGLPLYGGFSGSLGVLAIPPLDLKQVEIIKGSVSTLYGGGAIGGLINFISTTPEEGTKSTIVISGSTLNEIDANSFYSKKGDIIGITLFSGANLKLGKDINGDGFAESPFDANFTVHPRFFINIDSNNKMNFGLSGIYDRRLGGDINAIEYKPDSLHPFLQKEQSLRLTLDLQYNWNQNKFNTWTFKSAGSIFDRTMEVPDFHFKGTQYNSFTEINDLIKFSGHTIVAGLNFITESFIKGNSDSTFFGNYNNYIIGGFVQYDWQFLKRLSLEAGLRYDYHNKFGAFILPRISLLYKPGEDLSVRLALGTGYKTPSLFELAEPSRNLLDLPGILKSERSLGINSDINYHGILFDFLSFEINQAFYYTYINNAIVLSTNSNGFETVLNGNYHIQSYGTDTYIRFTYNYLETYIGYNHTESLQRYATNNFNMPFNSKDKFSTIINYDKPKDWRAGLEFSLTANQYIFDNKPVSDFIIVSFMAEKKFDNFSMVVNFENLFDNRQSKYESIVTGTRTNPVFKPVWMPLEGRTITLSLKMQL